MSELYHRSSIVNLNNDRKFLAEGCCGRSQDKPITLYTAAHRGIIGIICLGIYLRSYPYPVTAVSHPAAVFTCRLGKAAFNILKQDIFLAPAGEIYYPRAQIHCNTERNKTVIQKYAVSEILVLLIRNSYAHSIDQPSLKAAFTWAEICSFSPFVRMSY